MAPFHWLRDTDSAFTTMIAVSSTAMSLKSAAGNRDRLFSAPRRNAAEHCHLSGRTCTERFSTSACVPERFHFRAAEASCAPSDWHQIGRKPGASGQLAGASNKGSDQQSSSKSCYGPLSERSENAALYIGWRRQLFRRRGAMVRGVVRP